MTHDPKRIVERGYDAIAERYLAWSGDRPSPARQHALDLLLAELPPAAEILELGCGAGVPMTAALAEHHRVHGVDISARQVALAIRNVSAATFQQADWQPSTCLRSHSTPWSPSTPLLTSRAKSRARFSSASPAGCDLVASSSPRWACAPDTGTVEADWLGAPMYFSHHDAATNRRLVEKAGLTVTRAEIESEDEDGQLVEFLWLMARKPVLVAS